jgi:chorismate mutase
VSDSETQRLRDEIARRDDTILAAINERIELVAELKRHKERTGADFVDAAQEERLLERLETANAGPLSREGVRQLFRDVLALVKSELR